MYKRQTQTTVKKINHRFDVHVKDYNKKHEELKAEIHDTILQKQQEQEGTNNNIIQKLEEVDGRQRSTEQKLDETTKEKTTRIEELKGHLTKVRENQERLQRQLMEGECGILNRINGPNHNDLKYNGTDRFPMEFLKELSEIQELYYPADNIKWIGRHLELDAGI